MKKVLAIVFLTLMLPILLPLVLMFGSLILLFWVVANGFITVQWSILQFTKTPATWQSLWEDLCEEQYPKIWPL